MEPIFKVGDEVRFKMPNPIPITVSGEWISGMCQGNITSLEIIASSDRIKGTVFEVIPGAYNPKSFLSADVLDGAKYRIIIKSNHPAGSDLYFTLPNCCLERVTLTPSPEEFKRIDAEIASKTAHFEEELNCPCVKAPADFKSPVVELTLPDPDKPYKFNFKN